MLQAAKEFLPDVLVPKEVTVAWGDTTEQPGGTKVTPFKARFEVGRDLYAPDDTHFGKALVRRNLPADLSKVPGWFAPWEHSPPPVFFKVMNPKGTVLTAYGKASWERQVDRWVIRMASPIDFPEDRKAGRVDIDLDSRSRLAFGGDLPRTLDTSLDSHPVILIGSPEEHAYFDAVERRVKQLMGR